jgi:adenylate cyclase
VVLPFNNMSADPEQEYFSDGITEDIITDLGKLSSLFVIARNSAFVYKGKASSVPHVCRELGVRFALEGSIRKAGTRVRVTAQLIDGSSGGHLWAERYDRELTDIFEVQDDITQHIVAALKVRLSKAETFRIVDKGVKDVGAHDLFLRGRELLRGLRIDREMFDRATAYFRRAIELDSNYAAAYAGLGMAYVLDYQNRWSDAPERSLEHADRFASEAIARDDQDPHAHYCAALVAMFRKDFERWADGVDRALSLNPNYALALSGRGILHICTGKPAEAIPYIERAMRLDPAFRQHYMHLLGTAYFVAGDFEIAVGLFKDRVATNPTADLSRAFLASALGHLGKLEEACEVWRELKEVNPSYSHIEHITRMPYKDPGKAESFTDGLRKAGLVE